MTRPNLVARAKAVTLSPDSEWPVIAAEPATIGGLYTGYVMILAALGPVAGLIGGALWGTRVPLLGTIRTPIGTLVTEAVFAYLLGLVMTWVVSLLINFFAPRYGGQKDPVQAFKTAAYCYTPVWLVGALRIIPGVGAVVALLGLAAAIYAFVLLRSGLTHTMKSAPERASAYAGVVIVTGVLVSVVLALVVGLPSAKHMYGAPRSPAPQVGSGDATGTTTSEPSSRVEIDPGSPLGKLDAWSKKMEQAGQKLDQAQKSGDPDAQAKAFGEMMGTVLSGGDPVEALAPEKLETFLPETLAGRARASFSTKRDAAMGIQVAEAEASYSNDGGSELTLRITDTGSTKGIMMFAGWAMLQHEEKTDHGYEKSVKRDGRLTLEKWDSNDKRGEYSIIVGDRFVVLVSGEADDIGVLRSAAEAVDLSGLDALKNEGVKKGG
ncbi:MAG: YIP1 family protein [Deltaproteobacteria bacterium]|nr:YIP1 family protein [Deltaproteobacteria bacterium]